MLSDKISGEERMRVLAFPNPEGLFDTYSETKAAALFHTFVNNGTWQTPTLALLDGFARARDDDFVHDPRRKYLLKAWNAEWDPRNSFFLKDLSPDQYDALNARFTLCWTRHEKLVGDMHRAAWNFWRGPMPMEGIRSFPDLDCMTSWRCWSSPG